MLLAWVVLAVATALLFWYVRTARAAGLRVSRLEAVPRRSSSRGHRRHVIVFDASLPWVYHEVYLWAAAFAVGALAGLVARLDSRSGGWSPSPVACVVGAILTRTTGGWALAVDR